MSTPSETADALVPAPEDPTEEMIEAGLQVARATGLDPTESQIHDIWQAMIDTWMAREDK